VKYNFSHLVRTETVDVTGPNGSVLFSATIQEITHGQKTEAQKRMFADMNMKVGKNNKQEIERAMSEVMRSGRALDVSLHEEVAAIQSWTLTDADGKPVPVDVFSWSQLPGSLAAQIEEVIERLNPDVDDDTKSDDGDES
jgi:hypothetical protein